MIEKFKKSSNLAILSAVILALLSGCSSTGDTNGGNQIQNSNAGSVSGEMVEGNDMTKDFAGKIFSDRESLKGSLIDNVFSGYKPYLSTYYLYTKGIDYEQTLSGMVSESVYPLKSTEESSGLYVYADSTGRILDVKIDEFNGMTSESYRDSDYIVNFYNKKSSIHVDENQSKDDIEKFKEDITGFNGDIYKFQEKFSIGDAPVIAKDKKGSTRVHYYPVFWGNGIEPMAGVYILNGDSEIIDIKIDEPNFLFDRLEEHFGKSVPRGFYFLSPEKITVYSGKVQTYTQNDDMYNDLMNSFTDSLADSANTLRADTLNSQIDQIKSGKHAGVEFTYSKTVKIMYPDISGNPQKYEFDSIFVTLDGNEPVLAFGMNGNYGTAPIYMSENNTLAEFVQKTYSDE